MERSTRAASAVSVEAGQVVLVIVAHPDDETFGCGSLIAHAAAQGAAVTVVCATRGEEGEVTDPDALAGRDLAEVRADELHAAAQLLGAARVELLDYRDSGFDGPLDPRSLCDAPDDEVAGHVRRAVEEVHPDVVLVLDGSDGHRDHLCIRTAVERVLASMTAPPQLLLSCLARSVMRLWVEEMRAVRPDTVYLQMDPETLGTPDDQLVAVDTSHQLDLREAAIALHRSQTSPYEGLSPELRRAFLATDHVQVVDLGALVRS